MKPSAPNNLAPTAICYLDAGLSVLPAYRNGASKGVAVAWKPFQKRLSTPEEIDEWFGERTEALCVVCGAVSGNLEVIDFDAGGEKFEAWCQRVSECAPELLDRLVIETTPSGGRHVLYRCETRVSGNTKLAERRIDAAGSEEQVIGGKNFKPRQDSSGNWYCTIVLIETRGEGGVCLCAPSLGYELVQGSIDSLPVITSDERNTLHTCASDFNEVPQKAVDDRPKSRVRAEECTRPGDDFNQRGDIRPCLARHGWTRTLEGQNEHWARPGKTNGCSATLKDNVFYVFSSNAAPFEPDAAYTPFVVYALLEHDGNFARAASALRAQGFGPHSNGTARTTGSHTEANPTLGEIDDAPIPLGQRDPATRRLIFSPQRTLPTAEAFLREFHQRPEGRTLLSHAGLLLEWKDNRYNQIEPGAMNQRLHPWLDCALRWRKTRDGWELIPFNANPTTVKAAFDTIRAITHLDATITPPHWLNGEADQPPALEILSGKSANLHIPTRRIIPATPSLFTTNALEFDFDPDAEPPNRWIEFLEELFGDDIESCELLQDWFGYCLTADTRQQKALMLVGPRRSGKGTIGRVLRHLIGYCNVVGPTTGSLAGTFGLQPLIGKSLAIVSDARFRGEHVATVVERVLCIIGEDALTIDRKYLESVTMRLPTRFMFLTNELPRFNDSSTALVGRLLVLRLTQSWYGRENPNLSEQLVAELPGILHWAMTGWERLRKRGRFNQPESSQEMIQDLADLSSPVGAFVRDCCEVGPTMRAFVDDLYTAWNAWCERDGRFAVGTKQDFGRNLAAVVPNLNRRRSTGMASFYDGIGLKTHGT